MKKIQLDKFIYRCLDMNPTAYDITKDEEIIYYKFYNEWKNRNIIWVNNIRCDIYRNAYEGFVKLIPIK